MAMTEYLTDEGKELLAQMAAGKITVAFTKIQMGDGTLESGQSRTTMTELVSVVTEIEVYRVEVSDENVVSVTAIFDNSDMTDGFYFREKGLFASDGTNEVLFSYANDSSSAEYIDPPTTESVEKKITSVITTLQDTDTEVSITVKSGIYALEEDLTTILGNFATIEDTSVASKDYAVGEYLVYSMILYVVTAAITAGDTLTPDTNIRSTTVGEEMAAANTAFIKALGITATRESSNTASSAYAVGDYLIYNNTFYKVTVAIASGGTLTVGTNISKTTVGAILTTLNSNLKPSSYTALFSTQTSITAQNTSKAISVSGLSNYHKILLVATVGDGYGYYVDIVDRVGSIANVIPINNASITSGFVAQCIINVDWANNSIIIIGQTTGWAITTIHLDAIYGIY